MWLTYESAIRLIGLSAAIGVQSLKRSQTSLNMSFPGYAFPVANGTLFVQKIRVQGEGLVGLVVSVSVRDRDRVRDLGIEAPGAELM